MSLTPTTSADATSADASHADKKGMDWRSLSLRSLLSKLVSEDRRQRRSESREIGSVIATFLTTLAIFGIFMVQGIIIARILGPLGRGEFGTSIYFPRDILLYAGLLGGIEIVNSYAARRAVDTVRLKYAAARLGLISGVFTAVVAATVSVAFLLIVGKEYLVPFALICCLFLPWEHIHLTVSAVDRGNAEYARYNVNRLWFALAFPVLVLATFPLGVHHWLGMAPLTLMCLLFVIAKIVGLLPTLRGMDLLGTFSRLMARRSQPIDSIESSSASSSSGGSECSADDNPTAKTLLREGRPYALSMFASELFERLDVLLIVALATVETSGYYFVAVPAAALLTIAPNALGVFTFNAGADRDRRVTMRQAVSVMLATVTLQLVATVIFALIIPTLIILLYGNLFAAAIPFAMWLLPACAIKGYLQAADGYLKGRGRPMIGVWSRVVSIFVMLGFVASAYSQFDLISIPMAACIGQAVSMFIISTAVIVDVRRQQDGSGHHWPTNTSEVG